MLNRQGKLIFKSVLNYCKAFYQIQFTVNQLFVINIKI
jgi:hypothetical protein